MLAFYTKIFLQLLPCSVRQGRVGGKPVLGELVQRPGDGQRRPEHLVREPAAGLAPHPADPGPQRLLQGPHGLQEGHHPVLRRLQPAHRGHGTIRTRERIGVSYWVLLVFSL